MKRLNICGFDCAMTSPERDVTRMVMILYPMNIDDQTITVLADRYHVAITVVTVTDWDNMLTPWAAPGEPPGSPTFKGQASLFYDILTSHIMPATSHGLPTDLIGVSLSGLFTLWQWALHDDFENIASLSGSFWYPGFTDWLARTAMTTKAGRAYFLLGDREEQSAVKAFRCVGQETNKVISILRNRGIDCKFDLVAGNHFSDPMGRLTKAFENLEKV